MKKRLAVGKVLGALALPPLLLGLMTTIGAIGDKTDKAIAGPAMGILMAVLASLPGLGCFLLLRKAAKDEASRSWLVRHRSAPLLLSGVVLAVALSVLPFLV